MVDKGLFREDLYYRLNVLNIMIPPLRDRIEDIPLLAGHFIAKYCISMNKPLLSIDQAAVRRLEEYTYPGNIRELENMIERAIVVGNGKKITVRDLPFREETITTSVESLDDLEKKHIQGILDKYVWNISASAKALGIDRVTLYNKIRKFGLRQEGN
jgi:transcriptional regulator with PAS, ATPase and Fis domain